MSTNVVLVTTYELGHQSFGLASAAASLRAAGAAVTMQDLSIHALDEGPLNDAGFVGIYVPMHSATRLAEPLIRRLKAEHPAIYVCVFGLYAAMNETHLRQLGADAVLSGEFEQGLVDVYDSVASGLPVTQTSTISLQRLRLKVPDRSGLPPLASYAHLRMPRGDSLVVGYTEATRGCKHLCRHCPIVPVYQGRFVIVEPEIVLADIRQQVDAGARHITFGDPDFLNGPVHALRIVHRMHEEFPEVTYDVTIKVEHLKRHVDLLPELQATGCILVTSAIESFDEATLQRFDKRHTTEDLISVLSAMAEIGLTINPTFVTFTPWTTVDSFIEFLETVARLGLVRHMSPVQYAIRLLVPAGSRLLELPEMAALLHPFDANLLCYPWSHPDPPVDKLFDQVAAIAEADLATSTSRAENFTQIWYVAHEALNPSANKPAPPDLGVLPVAAIPYLTEPWYC
jgi:radical SAM superfamily enzyme YgiQ (UPF0313 family)